MGSVKGSTTPVTYLLIMAAKLDANRYATKKTIAQGMLDIALLTANASQLRYVLQVGESHEFYMAMLVLIITSIVLQSGPCWSSLPHLRGTGHQRGGPPPDRQKPEQYSNNCRLHHYFYKCRLKRLWNTT